MISLLVYMILFLITYTILVLVFSHFYETLSFFFSVLRKLTDHFLKAEHSNNERLFVLANMLKSMDSVSNNQPGLARERKACNSKKDG